MSPSIGGKPKVLSLMPVGAVGKDYLEDFKSEFNIDVCSAALHYSCLFPVTHGPLGIGSQKSRRSSPSNSVTRLRKKAHTKRSSS
jgi:hypothetical protein